MKLFLFLWITFFSLYANAQRKPFEEIEPGVWKYRGFIQPIRNSYLIDAGNNECYLIQPQFQTIDNAAMLNALKTEFPEKKLSKIFLVIHDYSGVSGASVLMSAYGKIPVYAAEKIEFSENEIQRFLQSNPRNSEAGMVPIQTQIPASFPYVQGHLALFITQGLPQYEGMSIMFSQSESMIVGRWLEEKSNELGNSFSLQKTCNTLQFLEHQNPSRLLGMVGNNDYPKYQIKKVYQQWNQFRVDYEYRLKEKMNQEEFKKSMQQRGAQYEYIPNDSTSLEILWKQLH